MTQAELLALGFVDHGVCHSCGGKYRKFIKEKLEVKYHVKKPQFKLYQNGKQVAFGDVSELQNKILLFQ